MKDPGATSLQKGRLVGKLYSGVVTVDDVAASPTNKAVVFVDVDLGRLVTDNHVVAFVKMRFAGKADDEKLLQLRKGHSVRLRGTLKSFSVVESKYLAAEPTKWANFSGIVVEGPGR